MTVRKVRIGIGKCAELGVQHRELTIGSTQITILADLEGG